ncbi:MAG: hypothetical protein GYA68_13915 [Syntrophorhabdus sp.]|nr:hypothetical protein [Syntrophorhabdus sp.]
MYSIGWYSGNPSLCLPRNKQAQQAHANLQRRLLRTSSSQVHDHGFNGKVTSVGQAAKVLTIKDKPAEKTFDGANVKIEKVPDTDGKVHGERL